MGSLQKGHKKEPLHMLERLLCYLIVCFSLSLRRGERAFRGLCAPLPCPRCGGGACIHI